MTNRRILLIDDNPKIHLDYRKTLCPEASHSEGMQAAADALFGAEEEAREPGLPDFELVSATQGQEGLEMLRASLAAGERFALALVDMRMPPGWDGLETIQQLWKEDPNLQVVIVSAYSDYSWGDICKTLGQTDQLTILKKPFDSIEIRQLALAMTEKWSLGERLRAQVADLDELVRARTSELEQQKHLLERNQQQLVQQEKLASLGQIAAGVAHEINNPVGFVTSNLGTLGEYVTTLRELLQRYGELRKHLPPELVPEARGLLAAIEEISEREDLDYVLEDVDSLLAESLDGAARVKDIVQNLKCFARVDEAAIKEADINSGIEATLKIVWNELKYKADIVKELAPIPTLRCQPGKLNQVFMNLLVNAAHALEDRGTITIRSSATTEHIVLEFADTGSGIDPEHLGKLFDPFFTTKPVGKGTGLGLSISYGIVHDHGGTIQVESAIGQGTTFTITLPLEHDYELEA